MKFPKVQSVACVVLGSLLGILAATFEAPPTLKASPIAAPPIIDTAAPRVAGPCASGNPSRCCYNPAINKGNPPAASAEAKAGRSNAPALDEESDLD